MQSATGQALHPDPLTLRWGCPLPPPSSGPGQMAGGRCSAVACNGMLRSRCLGPSRAILNSFSQAQVKWLEGMLALLLIVVAALSGESAAAHAEAGCLHLERRAGGAIAAGVLHPAFDHPSTPPTPCPSSLNPQASAASRCWTRPPSSRPPRTRRAQTDERAVSYAACQLRSLSARRQAMRCSWRRCIMRWPRAAWQQAYAGPAMC